MDGPLHWVEKNSCAFSQDVYLVKINMYNDSSKIVQIDPSA